MGDADYIVNSILCFINSAHADYSHDSLLEVAYSFYSHDEIKVAKELLCTLLKKDLIWRRDPDKKKKDLKDILEYHQELIASKRKVNIVTNTYKKMPPVGMSMFAPILSNLADEITKINEVLPKILDIKSEVLNTADTVRQMKIDISDIRNKFKNAINGMEAASKNMCDTEINVMEELQSFRQSIGPNDVFHVSENVRVRSPGRNGDISYAESVRMGLSNSNATVDSEKRRDLTDVISCTVDDARTGAVSKMKKIKNQGTKLVDRSSRKIVNRTVNSASLSSSPASVVDDDWKEIRSRNRIRREKMVNSRNETKVTGVRRTEGGSFRAAVRTADVFVGRVDNEATVESLKDYIKSNFAVDPISVTKLDIRSDIYCAFKVNVKSNDRDKLCNEELWPEDIIVNKFYNRYRNKNGNNNERDYIDNNSTKIVKS